MTAATPIIFRHADCDDADAMPSYGLGMVDDIIASLETLLADGHATRDELAAVRKLLGITKRYRVNLVKELDMQPVLQLLRAFYRSIQRGEYGVFMVLRDYTVELGDSISDK